MHSAGVKREPRPRANPVSVKGIARFGIIPRGTLGVPMPVLAMLARGIGRDHALVFRLWCIGTHEAYILAGRIGDSEQMTGARMDGWIRDFDSGVFAIRRT